jgi:hypothetical protein
LVAINTGPPTSPSEEVGEVTAEEAVLADSEADSDTSEPEAVGPETDAEPVADAVALPEAATEVVLGAGPLLAPAPIVAPSPALKVGPAYALSPLALLILA